MEEITGYQDGLSCSSEYSLLMSSLQVSVSKHIVDEHFTVIWANDYYYHLIGYSREEYENTFHNQCDLFFEKNPEDWQHLKQEVIQALADNKKEYDGITRFLQKDGTKIWVRVFGTFIKEQVNGCPVVYTVITDITDITKQQEQLEKLAYVDPVTGGWNRTRFELEVEKLVAANPPDTFVMVSVDIQKFKLINDLFGIEVGDRVLKHVSDTLTRQLNPGECIGRESADNFNLLLKTDTQENLRGRLTGMAEAVNSYNEWLERKYMILLSAGVYLVAEKNEPPIKLRDRANVARKNGKKTGGSALCDCQFYSELDRMMLVREKDVENRMRDALDAGEFVIYLQPKIALKDGSVAGAEALVRWLDPRKGLIFPGDFIPVFEKNGFIVELDLCVFEQTCKLLRGWMDEGRMPVPISVNMSRVHLSDPDYLKRYEQIREKYDIPIQYLEIELTETLIFEEPEALIPVIDEIHSRGYRCAIDDFGSGYSSLNVLKDLHVDVLKLDRVFFDHQFEENPRAQDVVSMVIELAERLNMNTVAEGVETAEQVEFLKKTSCGYVQGYAFYKPLLPEDFEKLAFLEA